MKFRLKVDISLVLMFVILINFGLINVLANVISRSSGYEVVTITTSTADDLLVPIEYSIHHNHTRQFKPANINLNISIRVKKCSIGMNKIIRKELILTVWIYKNYYLQTINLS